MIRVLLADDQKILREGLKMIIEMDDEIEVCGIAEDGREAVFLTKELKPDVVVMDIKMPRMNGVEATKLIKEYDSEMKVIVLTTFKDEEFIKEAIMNGAMGYLLKDESPDEIIKAIKTVYEGGALMNPTVANIFLSKMSEMMKQRGSEDFDEGILTSRDKEIIYLLTEGLSNKEIAKKVFLSEGTVKNHISRLLEKLDLRDRTQLAVFGVKNNIK
jgi:DNA-binding NarL/FixJ family response regulator